MKNCPFCNAEVPDEASFCLNCASPLNNCEEADVKASKAFNSKKAIALCISAFFILALSFVSVYHIKNSTPEPQNTNAYETILIPVTQENGEAVTNLQGDAVYEAVTVEATTKKTIFSEIISNIISKDDDKKPSDNNNDTTASATKLTETNPLMPSNSFDNHKYLHIHVYKLVSLV